ncbi:MAG TPA: hypothetical protein VK174_12925 [Chitinophagales bacterium]|nr:hypothetical protein [Chitinophagales bacterium]
MKKLLSVFLSVIILAQVLVNVGITTYYHLNKRYIVQQLCENRSNPQSHCNGHCYLSKQLKKASEAEKKQAQNLLKEKEEIIQEQPVVTCTKHFTSHRIILYPQLNTTLFLSDVEHALLKPPAA